MELYYLDILILINFLLHSIVLTKCSVGNFEIIKGIPIENAKLYPHGKDFSCLDGTLTIPYSYINDDYCDCIDASDEPGTSACPNGTFYCTNKGHFPLVLPSSRVNDGICDCCDGSDEWANNVQKHACQNTCENLSNKVRSEANRVDKLYAQGFKIRAQLITKGKYLLSQKQNKILHLLTKIKQAQFNRSIMFNDKEMAKKKEEKAIEEEKSNQQNKAIKLFNEIDTNKNNKIEVKEVIAYSTFNQNQDSLVSQNEIYYLMENKKELDLKDFVSNGWNRLNLLIFTKSFDEKQHLTKKNVKKEILNQDSNRISKNGTEKYNIEVVKINELLYTEKTKIIIDESKKAQNLFEESDRIVKDLQKQLYELQKSISKNFGPDDEFAALDGQCYELTNDEYIYKLCLFEKITQRPIKGGPEIKLGVWKDWTNFINDKPQYHTMLYDRGKYCLNHYQRFAYVHLSCGLKPRLISVSELNRCEYLIEFELPSVCVIQDTKYLKELEREEL